MPQRPQTPQSPENKGFFTNAVRNVANVVTGGALEREIAEQQQTAVSQQVRVFNEEIQAARKSEQEALQESVVAQREAERANDRRSMEAVDGIDVVRGRAIWNIQPGEIARRISEAELEEVEKLKGIIVQEGCSALIYANGELVSTLSSGAYLFYKTVEEEKAAIREAVEKAEKELVEKENRERKAPTFRQLGVVGEIGRAVSWVGRIIFGEKKNERKEKADKRRLDYARILARLTNAPVMSVYIVSDRIIPMIFGGEFNADGGIAFKPYIIPIGMHDVQIGVSLQLQIDDIHAFSVNYLADQKRVTVAMIQQMLTGNIETLLRQSLRNQTYEQVGLSADVVNFLKMQIRQTINQQMYGIVCTQVLNITDNNLDFERFRSVERELYNTEKEIDFMHRTGEFRNRMENEANAQQIQSAQNAEQLRYAFQKINKDQLLHDDELNEFVSMLESQRRIRDAKTQDEEFEAMENLRKNRLVKEDEMAALEDALMHNKIPREEITQIMRVESQLKIDSARMRAEWTLSDARTDHDWEREDLERRRNWGIEDEERERVWMREEQEYNRNFNRTVKEDDYNFQKMMREREIRKEDEQLAYERARQNKIDEDQLDANRAQRQIEKLQAMSQIQAQLDAQKYQQEANLASMASSERINRDNLFANMTPEQIRAAQLDRLSSDGQVAMANAYSADKEVNALRQQVDKDKEYAQKDKADMMNFAREMVAMVRDTAVGVNAAQQERISELQRSQEAAMNNLAQVSSAAAGNINAFNGGMTQQKSSGLVQNEHVECQCYNCGHTINVAIGTPRCPDCGAPFQW
jgi:Zn finger protein HypA/HybF involved in hydrogenase expression